MITFKDTYDSRKKEIEDFLELMEFLESKENDREDGISKFSRFFVALVISAVSFLLKFIKSSLGRR